MADAPYIVEQTRYMQRDLHAHAASPCTKERTKSMLRPSAVESSLQKISYVNAFRDNPSSLIQTKCRPELE